MQGFHPPAISYLYLPEIFENIELEPPITGLREPCVFRLAAIHLKLSSLDAGFPFSSYFLLVFTRNIKTYWPAGGRRGQNPENTAQGHSGQNAICP